MGSPVMIHLPDGSVYRPSAGACASDIRIYLADGSVHCPSGSVAIQDEPEKGSRPGRLQLKLTESEAAELMRLRDTALKAYQRERAAAMLKIAGGISVPVIARERLLRPRAPYTVYDWFHRFKESGIKGLMTILTGRGRKPAFSPSVP